MQDFINGFLKAWKAWSDDGKDAFLESFLDEVKNSKNDPTNFLGILEQEIKSLSQEGLKDGISFMLEVIESMKNEISNTKDNENVSDFFNAFQQEINEEQSISNNNPSEFVESLEKVIVETQENANKNEIELTEQKSVLEMSEDKYYEYQQEQHIQMNEDDGIARATDELEQQELESKTSQEHEENQIKRAEEISITENKNELAKQELEKYALEAENKSLKQYNESQNPDTLYEQQVFQKQEKEQEKELLNQQDLELETLRDNNTKQGLDNESATLLESLQVIRDETNEVANYLRANEIDYSRPTGENTTNKIASLALEENNQLNEKETNTQEQAKHTEKEQEKPKIAPNNDIDLKDKYANLHSFFKQTELDIKQKRIKTKLDFKESFLNYAKNHMNEDELKVLLVVSQKEPTKLTKEHINLIKDCLEQAHGNKHMQDKGLQLSVKSILGHELEKEHHEVLKDYLAKSKDSLEPMDNRVYEVMQKHLDKQQEKALKNLDSATQSVGVNAIKEQNKANKNAQQETKNSQAQETTSSQAYESVSQANTQATTQANESIKPQTNNTATQQENAKESQAIEQNRATQEPHAKEEPKKVSHPDEPWLDYNPKNHAGLKERQENQEKTPSKGNDEPWIEYGKLMQEKAKAHYQAMVEKERAKQQAQQNAKNTNSINTPNKEVAIMDYGYTQSAPAKSRKR
ncbi:relaxase/mobilization nuclease domain-containing protein [Helicobacter pylori]